jgi:hypothetical protein
MSEYERSLSFQVCGQKFLVYFSQTTSVSHSQTKFFLWRVQIMICVITRFSSASYSVPRWPVYCLSNLTCILLLLCTQSVRILVKISERTSERARNLLLQAKREEPRTARGEGADWHAKDHEATALLLLLLQGRLLHVVINFILCTEVAWFDTHRRPST